MKFYDWRMDQVKGGHGYHVDVGAFSTPITGGGNGTIIDQDQPDAAISCPAGYSIMPIRIHVVCQVPIIAADSDESEIVIAADIAAVGTPGATGYTSETAVNMHSGSGNTTACSCYSASTSNWTNPTLGMELAHAVNIADLGGTPASQAWGKLECLYEPVSPPILTGPCCIYIYWGGTVATTGFAQIEWIEISDR